MLRDKEYPAHPNYGSGIKGTAPESPPILERLETVLSRLARILNRMQIVGNRIDSLDGDENKDVSGERYGVNATVGALEFVSENIDKMTAEIEHSLFGSDRPTVPFNEKTCERKR